METLNYEIHIKAPVQKVWDTLWHPETYQIWSQFFAPGSQMESDWEVGGKTYFTDKAGEGMVSTIQSLNEPYEVVFSHLGTVKDGVEDTESRLIKEYSGTEEKYFLRAINENMTELRAIVHTNANHDESVNNGFNQGFNMVKTLAES